MFDLCCTVTPWLTRTVQPHRGWRSWGSHFLTPFRRSASTSLPCGPGTDVSMDEAQEAAGSAALHLLATVDAELGSLDEVLRIVHVYAVVNSTPDFLGQTAVIDAASAVFVGVFGERGRHARLAVGVAALPGDLVLEIEALVDVVDRGAMPPDRSGS
jgi:enamine deaminase RidA (YjgF/YER057c/UK114 family)